jgi:ribosomal protein S3
MGQKVHPLGFRVGITKKHQSQWFARFNKYKYSQSILEDRMIRDTLSKLFPELLNPILNNSKGTNSGASVTSKKRDEEVSITPRITQIKIERGLIPYEIGIQIHAENCELLKSAIDNLKVKRELIVKLQKTRRYLLSLKLKLKDLTNNTPDGLSELNHNSEQETLTEQSKSSFLKSKSNSRVKTSKNKVTNSRDKKKQGFKNSYDFKFRPKLSKQELRRQRLIKNRLKKRLSIRRRYRQLILKGLFIKKTGNKIIQTLSLKTKKFKSFFKGDKKPRTKLNTNLQKGNTKTPTGKNTFSSRIKKKFVTLFIQKMNKKFLSHLKVLLMNYGLSNPSGSSHTLTSLPLGYSKQWNLNRLNTLKAQPIYKLSRMIVVLEQKLLVKLESLRKEFIAFGSISSQSSESLGYFQILNFLKNLKELVNKLKREQKLQLSISKNSMRTISNTSNGVVFQGNNKLKIGQNSEGTTSLAQTVLQKKLNNIEDECRKVKLIEHIKDIVKKHRTKNIFFYLSTMADAGKDLKKIKQFTKRHANFLFGLNLNNFSKTNLPGQGAQLESDVVSVSSIKPDILQEKINERVSKVLEKASKKTNFETTLQDIFLEQIEKQRTMCLENLQLTPKISIKFYAVNKKTLEQKASIISESVVDALEKRKAFRKAIKDAKETLMRTPGVKGVKIQVAGRLNGAEIARTEWVRAGRVPLQTLRANLDYSYRTANTIYGIIGVRVWIFKGYAKLISK